MPLFPLDHYPQSFSAWHTTIDIDKPLLTEAISQIKYQEWWDHLFGTRSPWDREYLEALFALMSKEALGKRLKTQFEMIIHRPGQGINFRPYPDTWAINLMQRMNFAQFSTQYHFDQSRCAIAVRNTLVRNAPTEEPYFYLPDDHYEGMPFDRLQTAILFAGTPVYILGESSDHAWLFILTSSFMGWVDSRDVASANQAFIQQWRQAAQTAMVAIIQPQSAQHWMQHWMLGMAFPGHAITDGFEILTPVADHHQHAHIQYRHLTPQQGALMPWPTTPQHLMALMSQRLGEPYGWGGRYFYTDCSSELKNLFTPFGIWLPIHSSYQVDPAQALIHQVDLSDKTPDQRLAYLMTHGDPFMTIIYCGNHVVLYLGMYRNCVESGRILDRAGMSSDRTKIALTYQTTWKLQDATFTDQAIIGQVNLLPLLQQYPEAPTLLSWVQQEEFQLAYLNRYDDLHQVKRIDLTTIVSL